MNVVTASVLVVPDNVGVTVCVGSPICPLLRQPYSPVYEPIVVEVVGALA